MDVTSPCRVIGVFKEKGGAGGSTEAILLSQALCDRRPHYTIILICADNNTKTVRRLADRVAVQYPGQRFDFQIIKWDNKEHSSLPIFISDIKETQKPDIIIIDGPPVKEFNEENMESVDIVVAATQPTSGDAETVFGIARQADEAGIEAHVVINRMSKKGEPTEEKPNPHQFFLGEAKKWARIFNDLDISVSKAQPYMHKKYAKVVGDTRVPTINDIERLPHLAKKLERKREKKGNYTFVYEPFTDPEFIIVANEVLKKIDK